MLIVDMESKKEEVSTGLNVEKRTFRWRIKNFDVIRHSDESINLQKFTFKAGGSIDLETEWKAYLNVGKKTEGAGTAGGDDSGNWIGIFLSCTKRPKDVDQVRVLRQFSFVSANGRHVVKFGNLHSKKIRDYAANPSWGYPKFIQKYGFVNDIPLIDGCLVVELEFHLYAPTPRPAMLPMAAFGTVASVQEQFEGVFMKKLQSDLEGLYDGSSQASDLKVTIISKDKKEFGVNGGILAVRSPVFGKMLEVDMKEANTGVISIEDLSSKTVTVLLRFIYTGTLHEDWSKPDVIVPLVYAAEKYELSDLLEFLDNVLGKVCSKETAGQLLNLADKLGMKKATQEILERIKKDFSNNDDMLAVISSGCELYFS